MKSVSLLVALVCLNGCVAASVNRNGMALNGLVSGEQAKALMHADTADSAAARGDCVQQYSADGTPITSSQSSLSVCPDGHGFGVGGWNGGGQFGGMYGPFGGVGGVVAQQPDEQFGQPAPAATKAEPVPDEAAVRKQKEENQRRVEELKRQAEEAERAKAVAEALEPQAI